MYFIYLLIVLSLLCFAYLIIEKYQIKRARAKIKHVIHVNGIRGKSTTTRLIASGLRACGYKVACKTTGTYPIYSGVNGEEKLLTRLGSANIREQKRTLLRAAKEGAEFLCIECMAVSPELQAISTNDILNSDILVMTKILRDHIDILGENEREIAKSLCSSLPKSGTIITLENNYEDILDTYKRESKLILGRDCIKTGIESIDAFPENSTLALGVARALGLDLDTFAFGFETYSKDPEAFDVIQKGNMTFINALSANDAESIKRIYLQEQKNYQDMVVVLNSRADRPERTISHIEMLKDLKPQKVFVIGDSKLFVIRQLSKENIISETLPDFTRLEKESVVFACGNLYGDGQKLMKYIRGEEQTNG